MINWGILGTSFISGVLAKAIHASSTGNLIAIGSRSMAAAQAFATEHAVPKAYEDYQALLDDPDIHAIYIGLPNHLHKEWIIRCAQAGKHVLCEKPLVLNPQEAREVFAVVEQANIICMEALMYRYHPLTEKLQMLIESKAIGEVTLFHAMYSANIAALANPTAGGSIRNLGCYPVSLIRLLAQREPIGITAYGRVNEQGQDNQASAILKFENNVMAVVSTADDIDMVWQFEIYGTKGRLKMISNPWMPDNENNSLTIQTNKYEQAVEIQVKAEKPLYTYQIDAMNANISAGNNFSSQVGMSGQDSLGNITVLDEWRKIVTEGATASIN